MKRSYNNKISCLMVAQESRATMMERAIRAFWAQTWPYKELVLVTEGNWISTSIDPKYLQYVSSGITLVQLPISDFTGLTLGDLRNIGTARCTGDFVAQMDDDDVSTPLRLERMLSVLLRNEDADGVYLKQHTAAWPTENRCWISHERRWECTTLLKRHRINVYPALKKGEDTPMMKNLNLVGMDAPELYIRVVHGENTWNRSHFEQHWLKRERECTDDERMNIIKALDS